MILRSAIVLGLVGFICGFIGPMLLSDGNQGPMLGLLITGPGGAVLGAALGAGLKLLDVRPSASLGVTAAAAVVLAAATLWASVPKDVHAADLVEGEVRACVDAATLRSATVDRLRALEASRRDPTSRDWSGKFDDALARTPGVVVGLQVRRSRAIYEGQAPWSRGALHARAWSAGDAAASYLVEGSGCAGYPTGGRTTLAVHGASGIWPPASLAEMLDLKTAEPPPAAYAGLAGPT